MTSYLFFFFWRLLCICI